MIDLQWVSSKGYVAGGGLISPAGDIFYLNIPKNASTYLTNLLLANEWQHFNILTQDTSGIQRSFAFIRDPQDRWISGFATYTALHILGYGYGSDHFFQDYNGLIERFIFDQIIFDDHTAPQTVYLEQIASLNPVYLRYNNNLVQQIISFTGIDLNTVDVEANLSESNYDTRQISKYISERLRQYPDLQARVVNAFDQDYKFINTIEFYNDPR